MNYSFPMLFTSATRCRSSDVEQLWSCESASSRVRAQSIFVSENSRVFMVIQYGHDGGTMVDMWWYDGTIPYRFDSDHESPFNDDK